MTYKINLIQEKTIIAVTYEGEVSLNERLSAVHDLCCHYYHHQRLKLLIDSRTASQQMTTNEQIIFGRYLTERQELQGAFVATLTTPDKCINKVIIKEASDFGFKINSFSCEKEAINWLNDSA